MPKPIKYGKEPKEGSLDWMTAGTKAANELIKASRESRTAGFYAIAEASADTAAAISTAIHPIEESGPEITLEAFNELKEAVECLAEQHDEFKKTLRFPSRGNSPVTEISERV